MYSRTLLFVITAIVAVIFYAPLGHDDFTGRWGDATYGVTLPVGGGIEVEAVDPKLPAAKAGVVVGDRLVAKPFTATWSELLDPRSGERDTFTFERRDGLRYDVHLASVRVPTFSSWDRVLGILAILPATIFLGIAFMLVFLRPSVMTWAFYFYAIGYFSTGPSYQYFGAVLPEPLYVILLFVLTTMLGSFAVLPLLPFLLRFPNEELHGWMRTADRVAWGVIAVAFGCYSYEWYCIWSNAPAPVYSGFLQTWLPLLVFAAATLMMIKKMKHASPEIRQRFGFMAIGLVVSFIAYAIYFVPGISDATKQIVGYAVVAMPICVAYAVLRHRVMAIDFVLNRAIAYGIVSVIVIAIVSVLDWSLGRLVSGERLATGLELLVTVGVGFLLDRINRVIGGFVEGVLFRGRRIAEEYLRRAAAALPYATAEDAISDGLAQVPADALKLSACAVYRRSIDGTRFSGIATSTQTPMAPASFDKNHLLVRMLQSSERRIWLDELRTHLDPENAAIYVLAIPVNVRHELAAFTLYGAHANGAQLDPEEVELLEELAREASRAYDHVEAVRIREQYAPTPA